MEAIMERIAVALERIANALKHPDDDEDVSVVNRLLAIQSDLEDNDGNGIGITVCGALDDLSTDGGILQAVQQIADRVAAGTAGVKAAVEAGKQKKAEAVKQAAPNWEKLIEACENGAQLEALAERIQAQVPGETYRAELLEQLARKAGAEG